MGKPWRMATEGSGMRFWRFSPKSRPATANVPNVEAVAVRFEKVSYCGAQKIEISFFYIGLRKIYIGSVFSEVRCRILQGRDADVGIRFRSVCSRTRFSPCPSVRFAENAKCVERALQSAFCKENERFAPMEKSLGPWRKKSFLGVCFYALVVTFVSTKNKRQIKQNGMKKIRAAIVGYGNIGRYSLQALEAAPDFEIAGIVRRNGAENKPEELQKYEVVKDIRELKDVDVAILATPTRQVEHFAKEILALGINTVDSFDIHTQIVDLRRSLDAAAKVSNAVSVISAGWDPGSDSVVRTLLQAVAPKGITYTNFGPGMSMGHTVAVKAVPGVKAALSMTIPTGEGIHRRMVYIEVEDGYKFDEVAANIKADAYFVNDETHVIEVPCVDEVIDMGHGVNLVRKGVSGKTQNQLFEFNMKINNPALTGQVLVACARATMLQRPGCYTMPEIPVLDLLPGDREENIRHLV